MSLALSGYQIGQAIYTGARTLVYQGQRESDNKFVIIKFFSAQYPTFGELLQFRNQYTIAKNLDIPGIVQPLSLERLGNSYALVMEDWGGLSLSQYCQQQSLNLAEVLDVALQLATILHDLHQQRVIHKDIKPANVLIHPESKQVKLIDFSIASLLPKETQEIQNPNILEGTLAYLAPEQTGRMNRGIDYRADFYALGVTLYQLLSGQLPFESDDPLELLHCHIAKVPVPVEQVNPSVPGMVGAIVAKLMAKNAEDRYQSALGLQHDLQECLNQWQARGEISEFVLGQRDLSDRFNIPEKLYGREQEVQTLLKAFERVSQGASELMLVAGFSGIGKTVVVNEVHKPITQQKGYFIKGKFDQFNRNIPLSAFVQALRDLMGQLLCESDAQLAQWKARILDAVGENGQVLIEVIPELEQVIGPQPPAPELSGSAVQNRFNLFFQKFIQVFTTATHPLVIFLDDLQWTDSASLQLLKVLMDDNGYLLVLGAYRDNEVSPAHPLMLMIEELKKAGTIVNSITLAPLTLEHTNHLITDTLKCDRELAKPLTQLVDRKTQGNPFFTTQFLKVLHEDGYITFDRDRGYWQCDMAQVNALALTDDIVEFMIWKLQKLSENTQKIFKLAACIGNQFDLATLTIIAQQSETEVTTALWPALQNGLILPQSGIYKFYLGDVDNQPQPSKQTLNYRFLHDRVQQAAYALIEESNKQLAHFNIGTLLLQNSSVKEKEERIFSIVKHLNISRALIEQLTERLDLIELNFQAAQKAKAATAYNAAMEYLTIGIELLPQNSWNYYYEKTLALHSDITEVAYLKTDFEQMEHWASLVLHHAKTLLDTIQVQKTQILSAKAQGKLIDSITLGLQVLNELGITFPKQPTQADIEQAFGVTHALWNNKAPLTLLELPAMTDPRLLAAMEILTVLVSAAYMAAPQFMPLFIFKQVELSIQSGNSPVSIFSYGDYGLVLTNMIGDPINGYEFGELALSLLEKLQATTFKCRSWYVIHTYIKHWKTSLSDMLSPLQEAYYSGLETGDIESLCLNAVIYCVYACHAGQNLGDLSQTMEAYRKIIIQYKQSFCLAFHEIYQQTILNLLGCNHSPSQLTGEIFNQEKILPQLHATNQRTALFFWYLNQSILAYLFEQNSYAVQVSNQVSQYLDGGMGQFMTCLYPFFDALIQLTQFGETVTDEERHTILLKVQQHQKHLNNWAALAPMNHQHRCQLIEAERCRVLGQLYEAGDFYDQSIASAKANGFIQDEALANELAAKFYLDWGKEKVAAGYMQEAYYCYTRWGAKAKVEDLEKRYPQLLHPILQAANQPLTLLETLTSITAPAYSIHATSSKSASSSSINQTLDFAALLQISRTFASTIALDELLQTLTQTMLENSGADQCALILCEDSQWQVRVMANLEQVTLQSIPLENNPSVPVKLIQYVKNTMTTVAIDDLKTDLPVIDDYLRRHQPKSVLCLPILNQGNLRAILYLENCSTRGVFSGDRILILNFLCTQAAISLENARLYQQTQEKEAQYRGIFEAVSDGLLITDLETGKIMDTNPAYYQLHGYSYSEILSLNPLDFIPPNRHDKFATFLATVKAGQLFTCEAICKKQDGTPFYIELISVPFIYNGKCCGLSVIRNVTERKQMELSIQEKNRNLEQAMAELQYAQMQMIQSEKMSALGNLVAGVAHEVNNPIGFLNGSINNAKEYMQNLLDYIALYQQHHPNPVTAVQEKAEDIDLKFINKDLPKLLNSMQGATDRIKGISTSLRTFSRADTEHKIKANLHEGIDSTLLILKYRLKANQFRPEIKVIANYCEITSIECFPGQLNQVFMNILANAIDMFDEMAQGRSFKELEANPQQITICTVATENQMQISIRDNGQGMSEAVKARIFDHLFTTKAVGKGTGLGLAIARQIVVETHGGKLEVNSQIGQGTEFVISLPQS
ncbi:ATP-binding sensor histidine kinase [Oscillatoria acuminata]|uniref:histidine kinase n=1 Tax=Oscillatoria acuminata PCC 6304 TaxID=56110 RepID=K9THV2_9CYAN|nr:AAA family ATPase [Oscillatoria acuminata]AFY81978.1 PAS domain S-box [Oscillatoria acuminata PCC 6304]